MKKLKVLLALRLRGVLNATYNRQSKRRSMGRAVLMGLLMLYVVAVMMGLFGFMAYAMVTQLSQAGLAWMALAVGAFTAAVLCFIMTVFTMQSQIFQAKDNDMLFAMPLTATQIAASRLLGLLVMEYAYAALVMVPTVVVYGIVLKPSFAFYPLVVLLTLLLPLLPLALAGFVGYLFAIITNKLPFKNLIITLLSGAAFLVYLYFCMNLNNYMALLIARGEDLARVFQKAMPPFYHFAIALQDTSLASALIVAAWCLIPAALFLWLLSKGFFYFAGAGGAKVAYRRRPMRTSRPWVAVLKKEAARFAGTPMYMFNSGIGALFMVALSVMLALKGKEILVALTDVPQVAAYVPQAMLAALCFCTVMTCTTAPSISLEGSSIWILRSSPLRPRDVFVGKLMLDLLLLGSSVVISVVILAVAAGFRALDLLVLLAVPLLLGLFMALLGLYSNLKLPRFDYTSDTAAVKQSASVMVTSLGGMGLMLLLVLGYIFLGMKVMGFYPYCGLAALLLALGSALLWRLICTDGVRCYEEF